MNSIFNIPKFLRSVRYALRGLYHLLKREQNARVHLLGAITLGILAIVLHLSALEAGVLFFAVVLVFATEITNTAIEKMLDLVHPHHHNDVAFIKDALAGAVLISATIALVVAIAVFLPHVRVLFSH
jgi:diacylglycerol kinase